MLVCPQCQFDNPNQSQSCQRCGVSLIHKNCLNCDTPVSFSGENCPNCGAFTGTVWWAIIGELESQSQDDTEPLKLGQTSYQTRFFQATDNKTLENPNESVQKIVEQQYLDMGQRYRYISLNEADNESKIELVYQGERFQGLVLDCQPLQKSVLKTLLEQQAELLNDDDDQDHSDVTKDIKAFLWHQIGVPELAFPYLTLRDFCPAIPEIHDAWYDGTQEVILLTDRSHWQLLSQVWTTEELSILQIVYWLNEMTKLWIPLADVHCCQSLLTNGNLRVDEDQTFGLQRLYCDPPDKQPQLRDLAVMWQSLLESCQLENLDPLEQLLEKVLADKINTVTELRIELAELAEQQQANSQAITAVDIPPPLSSEPQEIQEDIEEEENISLEAILPKDDGFDTGPQDQTLIDNEGGEDMSTAVLPMQLSSLVDAGHTDIGRQRRHNEDYFGMNTEIKRQQSNRGQKVQARGLYIVCDGMGGHASGEVASAMAVESLQRYFITHWQDKLPDAKTIQQGIFLANQTIYRVNQDKDSYGSGRMGTTLVMALIQDTRLAIAHVGDSRIYRVNRKWGLEQLTIDHEVGQRAIQEGVDPKIAYSRPDAYQLTQALGPHDDQYIRPDIRYLDIHEDTLLLLCSDGLSDNKFVENNWQNYLTPLISSNTNLDEGIRKLIAAANQKNGHDNITAITVRIKVQPNLEQPLWV